MSFLCQGIAFLRRLGAGRGHALCWNAEISVVMGVLCLLHAGDGENKQFLYLGVKEIS